MLGRSREAQYSSGAAARQAAEQEDAHQPEGELFPGESDLHGSGSIVFLPRRKGWEGKSEARAFQCRNALTRLRERSRAAGVSRWPLCSLTDDDSGVGRKRNVFALLPLPLAHLRALRTKPALPGGGVSVPLPLTHGISKVIYPGQSGRAGQKAAARAFPCKMRTVAYSLGLRSNCTAMKAMQAAPSNSTPQSSRRWPPEVSA